MEDLIVFLIALIFCLIGRFVVYLIKRKRSKSKRNLKKDLIPIEIKYLTRRFKIKRERIDKKSFMLLASLLDGLIVGITVICVIKVSDIVFLQMILGLVVVLALIYITYECVGRIIVKKGDKE